MIEIIDIEKKYKNKTVLKNVNLTFKKGAIHIIYGKNGAGKSTLLKCILGILKIDKGNIKYLNIDKKNLGLVFNNSLLINKLKVIEYLEFICELKKIRASIYSQKINDLLKILDFDNERNTLIQELSKGTRSKLSLAASIIYDPEILILDEPFVGMDLTTIDQAVKLVKDVANKGGLVIISTHIADLLPTLMDEISILKNGEIKFTLDYKALETRIKSQGDYTFSEFLKKEI